MGKFNIIVDEERMAKEVAAVVNSGGQLFYTQTPYEIKHSSVKYYIKIINEKVVGVIGVEKQTKEISEIKHLHVIPEYRGKGIGRELLIEAINKVETPHMYSCVRETNYINMRNCMERGMLPEKIQKGVTQNIIVFARRNDSVNSADQ